MNSEWLIDEFDAIATSEIICHILLHAVVSRTAPKLAAQDCLTADSALDGKPKSATTRTRLIVLIAASVGAFDLRV